MNLTIPQNLSMMLKESLFEVMLKIINLCHSFQFFLNVELVIKGRLEAFFDKNNILINTGHDFTYNKSTDTAIYDFTQGILEGLDAKYKIFAVFCDLIKRAFDTVAHSILFDKL